MENKIKIFCNRCNIATNHTIKCNHTVDDIVEFENEEIKEVHWGGTYSYQIIECDGCETISFRRVDFFNQFMDTDASGKRVIKNGKTFETFYPERLLNSLVEKRIVGLPLMVRKAYQEIVQCYNFDLRILSTAGLRAITEGICNHFKIGGKTLGDRIYNLSNNGLISVELSEALQSHKFLGNFAVHRLEIPEKEELKNAIELLELALETLFGIPEKHKELREQITKRVSK